MRYRLRTVMIVVTAVCVFCGWCAFLRRMAAYHRAKAAEADADYRQQMSEHPGMALKVFWDHDPVAHHSHRARDFDHALLRPWLAFVHCKPGSTFGAPPEPRPHSASIIKRLPARDDGKQEGDY